MIATSVQLCHRVTVRSSFFVFDHWFSLEKTARNSRTMPISISVSCFASTRTAILDKELILVRHAEAKYFRTVLLLFQQHTLNFENKYFCRVNTTYLHRLNSTRHSQPLVNVRLNRSSRLDPNWSFSLGGVMPLIRISGQNYFAIKHSTQARPRFNIPPQKNTTNGGWTISKCRKSKDN